MPPIAKESREDDGAGRMPPDVIHLAPHIAVDSPDEPVIIEDLTGYEVIKGRYYVVIRSSQSEYLVEGERMDVDPPSQQKGSPKEQDQGPLRTKKKSRRKEAKQREVAQAFSMLRSSSNFSDITLDEKNKVNDEFGQRISL